MPDRTRRGVMPWLYYSHKSFFYAIVFEATSLIWLFVEIFFGGHDDQWQSPSLKYVNAFMAPQTWGIVAGVIGVTMLASLYRRSFRVTRVVLACAFWYILLNFFLILQARVIGLPVGSSLQKSFALLGNLFVQVRFEPPENPASE